MDISPQFATTSFEDARPGALMIAAMDVQGQYVVRGMKAVHQSEGGGQESYFVTLGPFVSHHGERPVVYPPSDLTDRPLVDISSCSSLGLAVTPQSLEIEATGDDEALGEILLGQDRAVMRIANFGRAGPSQTIGLDLATGELVDLEGVGSCFSLRGWRIVATDDKGNSETQFEFSL